MRTVLEAADVERGLRRVAGEVIERRRGSGDLLLVGVRRGGVPLAGALARWIGELDGVRPLVAALDTTLHRDDAATSLANPRIGPSDMPFPIDGRSLLLVDDVLHTGRTARAALDTLLDYGRPRRVELAVLVDRGGRELPIQPDYVIRRLEVAPDERVDVSFAPDGVVVLVRPASSPSLPPPPAASP